MDTVLLCLPQQIRLLESIVETEAGLHPGAYQVRAHRMAVDSGCLCFDPGGGDTMTPFSKLGPGGRSSARW